MKKVRRKKKQEIGGRSKEEVSGKEVDVFRR